MQTDLLEVLEYAGRPASQLAPDAVLLPTTAATRNPKQPFAKAPPPLTVLVLEGDYRLTAAVLFCLSQQAELQVHLLTRNARSPFRLSHYIHSYHTFRQGTPDADFVEFARQVGQRIGAEVLLPVDVAGMRFVIAHRPALEKSLRVLPLPAAINYEIAGDKGLLASFMHYHGIPAPATIINIQHELAGKLKDFQFPVLLKPIDGGGGVGIIKYQTPEALLQAVAELPTGSRYIIQHCLEGYDIDCNVLYQDGKLVAHSIQKGLMSSLGEYAPAEAIEFVHNDAVLAVVDHLMQALHWNGVAHLDLRYDARDQQIKVIEINTRFWLTVVGSALAAKVNFPALACQLAAGRTMVQAPFALGRYIPFANFLKYRFGRRSHQPGEPTFTLRDTNLRAYLGDPLTKLCRFLTD
jgi:predicted ATP-grasp superfamily ATP-dependent carboligase